MYIANTEDSSGWVILSNERAYPTIIAHSDSGSLTYDEELLPPALLCILENHMNAIDSTRNDLENDTIVNYPHKLATTPTLLYKTKNLIDGDYWKQTCNNDAASTDPDKIYNKFSPHLVTCKADCGNEPVGCGPVAMSKIMRYWQWPDYAVIGGIHDTTYYYDWEHMPIRIDNNTDMYKVDAVAHLFRSCGQAATTAYTCAGSATVASEIHDAMKEVFGTDNILPAHQGRACENILAERFVKPGTVAIMNFHFTTTKAHVTRCGGEVVEVLHKKGLIPQSDDPFKGDMDVKKLEQLIETVGPENVPLIYTTITNNTVCGQAVSMKSIRETAKIAEKYDIPFMFDVARWAENAYFIKTREEGYADKSIQEIAREMFSYADSMTMSAKKDGIVNMGGFIATNREDWYEGCKRYCIPYEGFITYGGMNGRDMAALAVGLEENTQFDMLQTRIHQVEYLAQLLDEYGIPYQRPAGGHAIFVDADKVLTHVPIEEFPAQTLTCELYLEAGIRACEIGYILADRDPETRENRFSGLDLVRLCIPRRVYTDNHMKVIAAALKNVYDRRETITRGLAITKEAPLMRHFTVELERLG